MFGELNPRITDLFGSISEVLRPENPLPQADVIIFTTPGMNRLQEATSSGALVLVPAEMVPDNQLQDCYRRKEWNGVLQIGQSYQPASV